MKFDELDEKMRVYETAFDQCAVPGMFISHFAKWANEQKASVLRIHPSNAFNTLFKAAGSLPDFSVTDDQSGGDLGA